MIKRQYSCPHCGTVYPHDKAYIHSITECQKKERANEKALVRD